MTRLVVDTSAIIAILRQEPGWERLVMRLQTASSRLLSVASWVELSLVVAGRRGHDTHLEPLDHFLEVAGIAGYPVDEPQARLAREAFLRFGKGRHLAGLNFGDCFSYALAQTLDAPLLFVGDDFSQTDVRIAMEFKTAPPPATQ